MTDVLDLLQDALADRYTMVKEIGRGGMAIVWLAEEHHPHRQVAIKVLGPTLSTRIARDHFVREDRRESRPRAGRPRARAPGGRS
jgi:hypothetical protein